MSLPRCATFESCEHALFESCEHTKYPQLPKQFLQKQGQREVKNNHRKEGCLGPSPKIIMQFEIEIQYSQQCCYLSNVT